MKIFDYSSYEEYLKEIYLLKKKKRPSYSYRQFSKDMGFKSPGYIKLIIESKHSLSERGADTICQALELDENESEYLHLLVKKSNDS